jgi:hypothetical protein
MEPITKRSMAIIRVMILIGSTHGSEQSGYDFRTLLSRMAISATSTSLLE